MITHWRGQKACHNETPQQHCPDQRVGRREATFCLLSVHTVLDKMSERRSDPSIQETVTTCSVRRTRCPEIQHRALAVDQREPIEMSTPPQEELAEVLSCPQAGTPSTALRYPHHA